MKDKLLNILGVAGGPGTTSYALLNFEELMDKTTPIITWVGLCAGTLLTIVMLIVWVKKLFK